ncbi:phosphatidylserine decarboxylase [Jeotgalibacillus proteolyticus]|uniref:phosphatidylserine decarboxylase n=1 Tax=Jeotgalibacillus proteolyticus TaxID=2082395 RepID=A0A2S5GEZ3_9BACL|nr:phosphatidylserine decarboxylase [Jeotgalibacillus proteolyticus]PPA71485.1 phosphatidylserine decarboxylase [Jeotgalibacillus proteolyticus]
MKRFIYRKFVELTNGRTSSLIISKYSSSSLSKKIIPSYKKAFSIKDDEWEHPKEGYHSLQDFFTRKVLPDKRPIANDDNSIISPVDGTIEFAGTITEQDEYVVKGVHYSLEELVGSKKNAAVFKGGELMVLYLSPANYHRIHSPVTGEVVRQLIIGRSSYPVNKLGLTYGDQPLSRNYRVVSEVWTTKGQMAFIKVGAMFVNAIHLTNTSERWTKGEEIGLFRFGSTVILLAEQGVMTITKYSGAVHMGEEIARFK